MKVGRDIGMGWPSKAPAAAAVAEERGFDFVTCGEMAHDSILQMTLAATATARIGLQTSVTIAFPRSPMVLAMQAWDIQQMSKGRFTLGLGSQVKGHNVRRFGGTWSPPAPRMGEYIQMIREIWSSWQDGKTPEFIGKHYTYTLMTPNFNPGPIEFDRPKVGLAVVGPGMARVAGRLADIVLPHGGIMSERYMREVLFPNVKAGLERSARTWSDVEISASGYLVLGDDDREIEQKLEAMRTSLSFYGSTRTYHRVLEVHGMQDLGDKLHTLSLEGRWQEMRDAVTLDHVVELAETCRYDDLPQFLADNREYASRVGLVMPDETPEQRERLLDVLQRVQAVQTPGVPRGLEF